MKKLLVCALYPEAKALIKKQGLSPLSSAHAFQIFCNDEYALVISGTGKIASASATAFLCTLFPSASCITNFGICGGNKSHTSGQIFLIDHIIDHDSHKNYYPDILLNTPLPRSSLRTLSYPEDAQSFREIVDMEASGFFESASHFFTVNNIHLVKIVSDQQDTTILSSTFIENLINEHVDNITPLVQQKKIENGNVFSPQDQEYIQQLLSKLYFTVTQERELRKLLWSLQIQKEKSLEEIISPFPFTSEQNTKNLTRNFLCFLRLELKNTINPSH